MLRPEINGHHLARTVLMVSFPHLSGANVAKDTIDTAAKRVTIKEIVREHRNNHALCLKDIGRKIAKGVKEN